MVIALDPLAPYDYICKSDRAAMKAWEEDERRDDDQGADAAICRPKVTTFLLCRLSARDAALLGDENQLRGQHDTKNETGVVNVSATLYNQQLQALDLGLKGWRDFPNSHGDDVPFRESGKFGDRGRRVHSDSQNALSPELIEELSEEIRNSASLSEDQAGN